LWTAEPTKGFPHYHVPNTNPLAQPMDPASRAATTEVKQGEEQIKHEDAFTL
jgi:hypothetical protein